MLFRHEDPNSRPGVVPAGVREPGTGIDERTLDVEGRERRRPFFRHARAGREEGGPRRHGSSVGRRDGTAAATASAPAQPPAAPVTTYNLLEIWQPENGASFFDADATVNVRIRSEPAVAEGDSLRLFLDGIRVEGADNPLDYTLAESRTGHALDHGHDPRRQGRREDPQPARGLLHEAEHDHRASRRRAEPEAADAADAQGRLTGACQQPPRRRLGA